MSKNILILFLCAFIVHNHAMMPGSEEVSEDHVGTTIPGSHTTTPEVSSNSEIDRAFRELDAFVATGKVFNNADANPHVMCVYGGNYRNDLFVRVTTITAELNEDEHAKFVIALIGLLDKLTQRREDIRANFRRTWDEHGYHEANNMIDNMHQKARDALGVPNGQKVVIEKQYPPYLSARIEIDDFLPRRELQVVVIRGELEVAVVNVYTNPGEFLAVIEELPSLLEPLQR